MRSLEPVSGEFLGWNTDDKTKRCTSLWDGVNLIGRAGRVIDLRAAEGITQRAAKSSGAPCFHRFLATSREKRSDSVETVRPLATAARGQVAAPCAPSKGSHVPAIGIPNWCEPITNLGRIRGELVSDLVDIRHRRALAGVWRHAQLVRITSDRGSGCLVRGDSTKWTGIDAPI